MNKLKRLITIAGGVSRLAKLLGMNEDAIYKAAASGGISLSMAILVENSQELGKSFSRHDLKPRISAKKWSEFEQNSSKLAEFRAKQLAYEADAPFPDPDSPVHEWLLQQLVKGKNHE